MVDPTRRPVSLDDERLMEGYRLAHADSAEPHLAEAEWEQLTCGELGTDALARAHAHITTCAQCAAVHRSLTSLTAEAAQFDAGIARRPTPSPFAKGWMYVGGLAAAAAIFAAVFVDLREPRNGPVGEVMRNPQGTTVSLVAPRPDAVLEGRQLAWQAVPTAEGYELRINTMAGDAIWATRAVTANATIPPDVALPPGRYYWQVTALRDNIGIASSALTAFRVN